MWYKGIRGICRLRQGLLLVLLTFSFWSYSQDPIIYSSENLSLIPIWNRVADQSPVLRSVEAAEISPNEKYVASASKFGYSVMVWNSVDGSLHWQNKHESEVECITFSPDSKRIASGGEDYYVNIWDAETGKLLVQLEHNSSIDGIAWSHDGKLIASGTEKGEVLFWNSTTYKKSGQVKVGSTVNSLAFFKDDKGLVVGGNYQRKNAATNKTDYTGFVKIVDVDKQSVMQEFTEHEASVKSVRISSDEKWIATGSFDKTARLFEIKTGKEIHRFKEDYRIEAVAFSPDNQFLLLGGHGKTLAFYDLSSFKLVYSYPLPRIEYLDFSEDGRLLVTSHEDSGLLALHLMVSDTQAAQGNYQKIADKQLNNKDLKKGKPKE